MLKRIVSFSLLVCAVFMLCLGGCAQSQSAPASPTHISVWTYYNGDQLSAFHHLVGEFNSTVGKEKGIVVESYNLGSVNDLQDAVVDSINGKVGAQPVPNIFAAYADTAYAIDQMGMLADLAPYLSEEERALYVDGYLEEGTLGGEGAIKIFPVAKSVELFIISATDFDAFAAQTGASYDDLATFEGLTKTAQRYYEWTDAQTEAPNDGKALFGRDSMANYFFIGAKQLGTSIVEVHDGAATLDFNKATVRKLWDNYYVPFVKGYFDASAHYRSDDVKTGRIIALVGSSSGATYFPRQVVDENGLEREIEMKVLPAPQFEGGEAYAVQQGAGMVVVDSSPEEVEASIEFLEWFTSPERNTQFSVLSGYLPVMKSANNMEAVHAAFEEELDASMEQVLSVGLATVESNTLYTPKAFEQGGAFRAVLENSLSSMAIEDAAAVKAAVAAGTSYEEALEPYLSDKYFNTWYEKTKAELEALVG